MSPTCRENFSALCKAIHKKLFSVGFCSDKLLRKEFNCRPKVEDARERLAKDIERSRDVVEWGGASTDRDPRRRRRIVMWMSMKLY